MRKSSFVTVEVNRHGDAVAGVCLDRVASVRAQLIAQRLHGVRRREQQKDGQEKHQRPFAGHQARMMLMMAAASSVLTVLSPFTSARRNFSMLTVSKSSYSFVWYI